VNKYLKQGGVFYFRYAGCVGDETLLLAEQLRTTTPKWIEHFKDFKQPMKTYNPSDLSKIIEKFDLVCEQYRFFKNIIYFDDETAYKKYVNGWLPHLYYLDAAWYREEFLDEIVKLQKESQKNKWTSTSHGRLIVVETQVEIYGRKAINQIYK